MLWRLLLSSLLVWLKFVVWRLKFFPQPGNRKSESLAVFGYSAPGNVEPFGGEHVGYYPVAQRGCRVFIPDSLFDFGDYAVGCHVVVVGVHFFVEKFFQRVYAAQCGDILPLSGARYDGEVISGKLCDIAQNHRAYVNVVVGEEEIMLQFHYGRHDPEEGFLAQTYYFDEIAGIIAFAAHEHACLFLPFTCPLGDCAVVGECGFHSKLGYVVEHGQCQFPVGRRFHGEVGGDMAGAVVDLGCCVLRPRFRV